MLNFRSLPFPRMTMTSLVVLVSVYFGTVMNYPVLSKIFELSSDVPNPFFALSAPLLLTCAFIIIFSAFAWPYFFRPFIVLVILSSAAALYAQVNFQTMFDMTMMESIFETNSSEVSFYLNSTTLLYMTVLGVLPTLFVMSVRIVPHKTWFRALASRVGIILLAVAGIGLVAGTSYKDYASVGRNNHYLNKMIIPAHIYNGAKYLNKAYFTQKLAYKQQGTDAKVLASDNGKPTLMVVVLGETARAQNFAYNGYQRNTNPYTQNMGLIAFQDVSSCGTYTALSVPCMFSNMTRNTYDKPHAQSQDNALDVIQHAGVDVLWVDNDGGDKGVASKITYATIDSSLKSSQCDGTTCFDMVMMEKAKQFIDKDKHNKLLILHTIGSHGPTYWNRYPEALAPFQPACNRSDIEKCSDQQITNVYDNTLVYTDYVLAQVIKELKTASHDYNVMMTYISDHGESLGESGMYLHGTPYAIAPQEQTQVPWLVWIPKQYAQQKGLSIDCLSDEARNSALSHDNLFHSLLGLYGVKTDVLEPSLDITNNCRVNG